MKAKLISFGVMVLSLLIVAPYGFADETGNHGVAAPTKVSGVVSKVQSGLIHVKTSWGSMTFSLPGSEKLKVGEEVEMQVNENNAVIDVHRKGEPAHFHRYVTGDLVYTSSDRREIKLWTPEGEKSFDVQAGRSKLAQFQEGAPVTIELNEEGKLIDIHKFTVEMVVSDNPRTRPGYRIQAHGTVEKIQSGLIFIKTPTGRYTVPGKLVPSNAAVGDEVMLWINEEGLVIDGHGEKRQAGLHRLVFGKLVYVGRDKKQIKLRTPEGEKVFPLERLEVKAKVIPEGSNVVVELNEEGTVIELKKAQ
ncbi:hypothetical protein [Candidatus Nitrospira nitrificans]|uniref:DUF5666 domain-containing protein n=1 Tax=Candidatus Nitrospira nitrificans TaxID=1742973 RepID=A0A0S4L9Q3_9BACT|nr:hypothetical protein [Candidatus Nitrospira nitrificans]CUS32550.1 conserved exported hypothetical protein [Candidatus Nitrospira nitrificans]